MGVNFRGVDSLNYIIDFLKELGSFFQTLIGMVVNLIQQLITFVMLIPVGVNMLITSVGYLPSILIVFATLSITISVIYLVLGRGQGG